MLSFADATGNLFNRWGRLGKMVSLTDAFQGDLYPAITNTATGAVGQYNSESDIQALLGSTYIGTLNAMSLVGQLVQGIASITVSRMVYRDTPQYNQNLQSQTPLTSLIEVIRQMREQGATVQAMTITATPTDFTGTGDGVIVASVNRPLDGLVLENSFAENVLFTCTGDSYSGTATAGNEPFSVTGVGAEADLFAFDWPLGSNGSASVNAINGNANVTAGNLLTNSGFTDWTANAPDNFVIALGTAGTNIFQESGLIYNTGSALRLLGDGTTNFLIRQQFDSTSGTVGTLDPLTQYAFNIFIRRDGVIPSSGVLTFSLVDDSFNVILDENGVANSFTVDLTVDVSTDYQAFNTAWRTPSIMPDTCYWQIELTTALENGRSVYLDFAALGAMTQLYTSGPFFAVFAGSIPFQIGDFGNCQITNSRGAAGTLDTWQTLIARLMPNEVYGNEILLPSSNAPTISDALITR